MVHSRSALVSLCSAFDSTITQSGTAGGSGRCASGEGRLDRSICTLNAHAPTSDASRKRTRSTSTTNGRRASLDPTVTVTAPVIRSTSTSVTCVPAFGGPWNQGVRSAFCDGDRYGLGGTRVSPDRIGELALLRRRAAFFRARAGPPRSARPETATSSSCSVTFTPSASAAARTRSPAPMPGCIARTLGELGHLQPGGDPALDLRAVTCVPSSVALNQGSVLHLRR